MSRDIESLAAFAGGVVAGEGCFTRTDSPGYPRFIFEVGLGAADTGLCEFLRELLGVGCLVFSPRRKPHYDDEIAYVVRRLRDLVEVVVPFMDEHLPPSYKRQQYHEWRTELLDYWEHRAKRQRLCTKDGCNKPRRAKGLCRRHYFQVYGR